MAETVNPLETPPPPPPPPPSTAPSTSTPSQPPQVVPQISSPAPQISTSSGMPLQQPQESQQLQQPPSQSPAPTMPPSLQPQPQPQPQTPNNLPPSTTSTSQPARPPPGAPGRNYLNNHLSPYLRTGMTNILEAKPQYPLRWLGEYLISQSLIHEGGTDEKGVVDRFIYAEHGAVVKRMRADGKTGAGADEAMDMVVGGDINGVAAAEAGGGQVGEDTEMGGS